MHTYAQHPLNPNHSQVYLTAWGVNLESEKKKDYGHADLCIGRSTPGERR
jgi:hypothetical protein